MVYVAVLTMNDSRTVKRVYTHHNLQIPNKMVEQVVLERAPQALIYAMRRIQRSKVDNDLEENDRQNAGILGHIAGADLVTTATFSMNANLKVWGVWLVYTCRIASFRTSYAIFCQSALKTCSNVNITDLLMDHNDSLQ